MSKRLTKPYDINARFEAPLGLLGVPPDFLFNAAGFFPGETVIIVTNNISAQRMLNSVAHPHRNFRLTN